MKHPFTLTTLTKNKGIIFTAKVSLLLLLAVLMQPGKSFAHTVDYFTQCGYTCSGSNMVMDAHISNTNSSSKYNWQYRDNSQTWKCFVNGNNTINGTVFVVSGAIATGTKTSLPITITNAKIALENVELRLVIADGGSPCNSNATYTMWGKDKLIRLHVLSGDDCNAISTLCSMGGCPGNMLYSGSDYYGGFENGNLGASPYGALTKYNLGTSQCVCGEYKIVNNVREVQSGYPDFAPHSGNKMMYVDGDDNAGTKVWYKSISVNANTIYQFSAWVANANSTNSNKANIKIKVVGASSVEASISVTATAGNWQYVKVTYTALTAGTVNLEIYDNTVGCSDNDFVLDDICFKPIGPANTIDLGNLVWNDIDADGMKDTNEPIVPNATVKLYKADGTFVTSTTTNASGIYNFSNLPAGRYFIGVTMPTGYVRGPIIASSANPDNNIDNDNNGVTLVPNVNVAGSEFRTNPITLSVADNFTLDVALCGNGSIGDFVWSDNNANGIQDAGEPGIANVPVMITYPDGTTATKTTDGAGKYLFLALAPGVHKITFTTPTGYTSSPANSTADDTKDSDPVNGAAVTVNLAANSNDYTIDAGFYVTGSNKLTLGNLVWNDINNDGNVDDNEPGVAGATVRLYADANKDNNPDGAALTSTITNTDGSYSFAGLAAGDYIVGVVLPTGYTAGTVAVSTNPNDNVDNDNNGVKFSPNTNVAGSEVRSNFITLSLFDEPINDGDGANTNSTLDFALRGAGVIGDFVFNDQDKDGIQDANEIGIANVTVTLTFPDNTTWTTLTDDNGKYQFYSLGAGTYKVSFETLPGMAPSPANQGTDDTKDSDPTGGTATVDGSVSVTLAAGATNNTIDAGFYKIKNVCTPTSVDTDGDCIPDIDDIDDDNDGILDVVESGGYDPLKDCDNDGIPNYKDPTPGCPLPTGTGTYPNSGKDIYGKPYTPITWTDCNNDGINDYFDWDKDGIINELDLDSDNDGILDVQEARDNKAVDNNHDGMVDGVDNDGDGLLSTADYNDNDKALAASVGLLPEDLDKDGTPNYKDLDSDGDGLSDNREALQLDLPGNDGLTSGTDADKDGVRTINYTNNTDDADNFNGFGAKGIILLDNDNDGAPNPYDIDTDNDGITDNVEGQPTCSEKQPTGIDTDGDGLDDAYDTDNNVCVRKAYGITPYDKDGDGKPDIRDLDTDNDGAPDVNEGSGIYGTFVPVTFLDADNDGLMDQFDIFNIRTATSNFTMNVVHSNMGPSGSFDGPVPGGSNVKLPGATCPGDRDWRSTLVLPVTMLDFKGNLNNGLSKLTWTVTNEVNVDYYIVERSINGSVYAEVGRVKATAVNSTANTTYIWSDNVSSLTNTNVYYRLKQVEKTGTAKLSNVLTFKLSGKAAYAIGVFPNPATNYFTLKVNAVKDGTATIRVTDFAGRILRSQTNILSAGSNAVTFNNISNIASGTYNVQVLINGEVMNERLIIAR